MSQSPPLDPHTVRPTRAAAVRGAFWAALGSLLRYALSGVVMLVLTRLLTPADFGLVAITFAVMELIATVAPVGFHDALIQRPQLTDDDLDAAFWSILGLAGGLTLLVTALAPLIAHLDGEPRLGPLLIGMALASLAQAVSMVPRALLSRRLDFRTPALVHAGSTVVAGVCGIGVALVGGGPWSRIVQIGALHLTGTVIIWRIVGWRPHRRLPRRSLRPLWTFAPSVAVFTVLSYVMGSADDQLVGYRLGTEALGYYALAYSFMAWPVRDVLGGIATVIYPIFARFQDDLPRFRAIYLESLQLTAALAFPTLVFIALTTPVLVPWLFGARWQPAVLAAQILAVGGLREATIMLNGPLYRALGRPELHTLLALNNVGCYLAAFVVGLDFGIEGVAFFFVLTGFILQPLSWWLALGLLRLSLRSWLGALAVPAAAAGLMALAAALALHQARAAWHLASAPALFVTGLAAGSVYGLVLLILAPPSLKHMGRVVWDVVWHWANDYTNKPRSNPGGG